MCRCRCSVFIFSAKNISIVLGSCTVKVIIGPWGSRRAEALGGFLTLQLFFKVGGGSAKICSHITCRTHWNGHFSKSSIKLTLNDDNWRRRRLGDGLAPSAHLSVHLTLRLMCCRESCWPLVCREPVTCARLPHLLLWVNAAGTTAQE